MAAQIGQGWREYLIGLIQVLHYAEHSLADLRDAQGLLSNVWAVVTADGKVSSRERKRLISTGNELYKVLALVHSLKDKILLDSGLLTRLGAESWEATLDAFKLPPATNDNLQQWITVIDGWVNSAADSLSALVGVTLEQLLWTEVEVARHGRELSNVAGNTGVASHIIATAPSPSVVPSQYPALLQGQERKRQQRLGIWDRFQTADGLLPGIARLVIAVAIVGSVLGFAYVRHSTNDLSIYNGLGIPVEV